MPNTNWMIFLAGLVIGILGAGYIVYEIEQTKYLSLENSYQDAVTKAQNKVIEQDRASNAVNTNIGEEYAKLSNDVIDKWRVNRLRPTPSDSLPIISKNTSGTAQAACDCGRFVKEIAEYKSASKTAEALCAIQINEVEKWQVQQCKIHSCQP